MNSSTLSYAFSFSSYGQLVLLCACMCGIYSKATLDSPSRDCKRSIVWTRMPGHDLLDECCDWDYYKAVDYLQLKYYTTPCS